MKSKVKKSTLHNDDVLQRLKGSKQYFGCFSILTVQLFCVKGLFPWSSVSEDALIILMFS